MHSHCEPVASSVSAELLRELRSSQGMPKLPKPDRYPVEMAPWKKLSHNVSERRLWRFVSGPYCLRKATMMTKEADYSRIRRPVLWGFNGHLVGK